MHVTDQMEQEETSFSSTNPRQTDATIALLHTLVPHFQGTIRVVCLYAGQTTDIAQRCNEESIEEVIVTTADSTQGYEADLTIVTTTLSGRSEQVGFWAEEARVNVALSRSCHGLILIGNFSQLWRFDGIWKRYIRKGLEFTQVVTPEYLDFFTDTNAHYVNDILVGPSGQPLTHRTHMLQQPAETADTADEHFTREVPMPNKFKAFASDVKRKAKLTEDYFTRKMPGL
ncbi:hypothetical protein niasHT_030428 [Heterodera trifolii]|uniref:DNA2/NAM7 helicase-like C-terminal domain-containing protein n=1 Tax=Heterodera trifolii TaxID=157864 RepID=A0ABD2IE52_9BILA